ncbi:hypothetical protein APHWI1_1012 [Anaplasma phagocytophilum str. ApWI1]|uniref:Uncharacterized protein n=4 Tax=Anaplasma phagocytophilum TaxID=948 RepID=Q2GLU0_ANAPZ|nr:hypothetical protein APH_0024 [Anaplasma phagocytophilum str. HZ]KJV59690.1 hypothetical protein APHWEB_0503 [Anaplasma phagocytophilum str. Webster]KJV64605.1 hypothetical protein APHMUC_1273 [Anaplasma phagocytophilum str. ApMUC09]KJV66455.1 hypothetical protein APHNP_1078 [Anaplasma phagocytophilum str. ApNP]KJV84677.1 hypothetical protein APHWI1_1012 [Anaplasma phagocytophilum str. ApWI1]KJV86319.1 hypothetical protein APHNYW_1559 [Anaplasma phagocytophilum str. ApNYW]KJV99619.1 hypoth
MYFILDLYSGYNTGNSLENNIASDTLKSTVSIGLSYANKVAK